MLKRIKILLLLSLFTCGAIFCHAKEKGAMIKIGMKLKIAEQLLLEFNAQKTMLGDFALPNGKNLIPYKVTPDIEIHFLVDASQQDKTIENIYICKNRSREKSEQKWDTVENVDLVSPTWEVWNAGQ